MTLFDIALKIKAKNGVLQKFIDERGWNQSDFARAINVHPSTVGTWFNMREYPHNTELLLKISELLQKKPDEIFPQLLKERDFLSGERTWTIHKELELEYLPFYQIDALPAPTDSEYIYNLQEAINKAITKLTPAEQEVIKLRFGLEDGIDHTLREVADIRGCSYQNISILEKRALRKLRHPSRSQYIKKVI